ncbi:hypothetical protein ElyMa_006287600 [Elysia marginata]|uniref:Uncharacterized protein n=1 Tax=Elysia marginata TaxID=1093978 RepID=A0AAV4HH08_9GAST|nr:hypothetical protein ElyMa_006287600 [Elysia marginata]
MAGITSRDQRRGLKALNVNIKSQVILWINFLLVKSDTLSDLPTINEKAQLTIIQASRWEALPDLYIFYPLPPWRAEGKGDTWLLLKLVGIMDTHEDPHLRRIPECPYPRCLNPPGQEPSGEAEKGGGVAGEGQGEAETFRLPYGWQTHLNHQDPHPASHGSHLTANKVPNSREISRFRGIEESDRTTEVRQEDGKKIKQEGKCLFLVAFYCVTRDKHTVGIILCSPPNEGPVPTRAY